MIYNRFERYFLIAEGYEITLKILLYLLGHEKYVKKYRLKVEISSNFYNRLLMIYQKHLINILMIVSDDEQAIEQID